MFSAPEFNPNVPAFISKLWHMLSDSATDDLISWSKEGTNFNIHDQAKFSTELLPKYYKHNNLASFIRQLNMYGFHKVLSVESSSMKNDTELGFSHPYFLAGHPELLDNIKRKMATNREMISDLKGDPKIVNKLLHEVKQLQNKQEVFDSKLAAMKNENDALWREHSILRQRHAKQQKIVNKLIQFLVTLVQQNGGLNMKRLPLPLMIKDAGSSSSVPISMVSASDLDNTQDSPSGPIICEVDPTELSYEPAETSLQITNNKKQQPLLLMFRSQAGKNVSECVDPVVSTSCVATSRPVDILELDQSDGQDCSPDPVLFQQSPAKPTSESSPKSKTDRKRKYYSVFDDEDLNTPSGLNFTDDDSPLKLHLDNYPLLREDQTLTDGSAPKDKLNGTGIDTSPVQPFIDLALPDELVNDALSSKEPSCSVIHLPDENDDNTGEPSTDLSLVPSEQLNSKLTGEFTNHLDVVQSDLDILKELLKGEGLSLDASTLMDLFPSEDPLSLNMSNQCSDYRKDAENSEGIDTELVAYPHLFLDDL